MGWPELLRVLREEADREVQAVRQGATAGSARIVAEARRAAEAEAQALVARERLEGEAHRRGALADASLERERARLVGQRQLLDALRAEVATRLPARLDEPLLLRLVGELVAAAPPGRFVLRVDPGDEARVEQLLRAAHPEVAARAEVRAAGAPRGGVALEAGRLELDDTVPSRLARAWPALEAQIAAVLFEGAGPATSGERRP